MTLILIILIQRLTLTLSILTKIYKTITNQIIFKKDSLKLSNQIKNNSNPNKKNTHKLILKQISKLLNRRNSHHKKTLINKSRYNRFKNKSSYHIKLTLNSPINKVLKNKMFLLNKNNKKYFLKNKKILKINNYHLKKNKTSQKILLLLLNVKYK